MNKLACTGCFGGPKEVVVGLGRSIVIRGSGDSVCHDGACVAPLWGKGGRGLMPLWLFTQNIAAFSVLQENRCDLDTTSLVCCEPPCVCVC